MDGCTAAGSRLRVRAGLGRSGGRAALAGAALLLWALAAGAAQTGRAAVHVEGGETLSAGQVVRVTWDALPADTEEFELLLRCDLPRPVTVRLTESQDPGLAGFAWRVPNVPCLSARLVLRRGGDEGESLWGESAPFRIRSLREEPVSRAAYVRGELWLPQRGPRPSPDLREGSSLLASALGGLPAAALAAPSKALAARPARAVRRAPGGAALGPRGLHSLAARRAPSLQLRI